MENKAVTDSQDINVNVKNIKIKKINVLNILANIILIISFFLPLMNLENFSLSKAFINNDGYLSFFSLAKISLKNYNNFFAFGIFDVSSGIGYLIIKGLQLVFFIPFLSLLSIMFSVFKKSLLAKIATFLPVMAYSAIAMIIFVFTTSEGSPLNFSQVSYGFFASVLGILIAIVSFAI